MKKRIYKKYEKMINDEHAKFRPFVFDLMHRTESGNTNLKLYYPWTRDAPAATYHLIFKNNVPYMKAYGLNLYEKEA